MRAETHSLTHAMTMTSHEETHNHLEYAEKFTPAGTNDKALFTV